jgi:hypothetical protein
LVEEEEFLARFKREARAVAALRHPNVVQVFDFDAQGDMYYMVMELLEGDSLRTRLNDYRARGERVPWGEMSRILLDVLAGLGYAHSEGMIHRDVKPANILLTRRGQAVLTDFGIAQIVGGTQYTVSGALMGTLNYMAPEQGLEGHCDIRSDIYSLGIVLYEILTGEPPFDAETPLAILMKHVNDPLPLPRQSDPSIPVPFERVVLKALAKRPGDRYQSAEEMARALSTAAEEAGVELPARISLPLSFTTVEAPSESVAVLSGSSRGRLADAEFATKDTDMSLGDRLGARLAAREREGAAAGAVGNAVGRSTRRAAHAEPIASVPPEPQPKVGKPLWNVFLQALGLIAIGNLFAVMLGGITGWGVFERGWPFELLLVGLGLNMIMSSTGSTWMVIPTTLLVGHGFLFSYYALTNWWEHWNFLWPLEPLLVGAAILLTLRLSKQEDGRRAVRHLATRLRRPTYVMIVICVILGTVLG